MKKTIAMRLLDKQKIKYETVEYKYGEDIPPEDRQFSNEAFDLNTLFKTLVTKGDKTGIIVAVIPLSAKLSLKKLSKVSGNKKMTLLPLKDLQANTGYVRGGCSPLGMKKEYATVFDESALRLEILTVNAGQRGLLITCKPNELITAVPKAKAADILMENE